MPATGTQPAASYREQLYECYVRTQAGPLHAPSLETLERDCRVWGDYFRALLPTDKHARLLDLGCGYGSFLYFLRKEGYANVLGVDASPEQIAMAQTLAIPGAVRGDCREFLENRAEGYDCITAFDLLEHLTKDETLALLRAAHQALAPGGLLLLKTPNADGPFGAKVLYSDFTHEQAFTPRSIAQVLSATGFEQIEVLPEGPRVHGLVSTARWAAWQVLRAALVFYLGAETGRVRGHVLTQNLIATARKPGSAFAAGPHPRHEPAAARIGTRHGQKE